MGEEVSTFEDRLRLSLGPHSSDYHRLCAVVQQRDLAEALTLIGALRCALKSVRPGACYCDPQPMGSDAWRHSDGCDLACRLLAIDVPFKDRRVVA